MDSTRHLCRSGETAGLVDTLLEARAFGSGTVSLFVGMGALRWVWSVGWRGRVGIRVGVSAVRASVGGRW